MLVITFSAEKISEMKVKLPHISSDRLSSCLTRFSPMRKCKWSNRNAQMSPVVLVVWMCNIIMSIYIFDRIYKFTVTLNFRRCLQATTGRTRQIQIPPSRKSSPPAPSHLLFHSVSSIFIAGFWLELCVPPFFVYGRSASYCVTCLPASQKSH